MQPRVTVHEAAVKLDGPLLFMRRTLDVGLGEAVEVASPTACAVSAALPHSTTNW